MDRQGVKTGLALGTLALAMVAAAEISIVPWPQDFKYVGGVYHLNKWANELTEDVFTRVDDKSVPAEGYELSVKTNGITVRCSDDAGAFYALQTLRQIAERDSSDPKPVSTRLRSSTSFAPETDSAAHPFVLTIRIAAACVDPFVPSSQPSTRSPVSNVQALRLVNEPGAISSGRSRTTSPCWISFTVRSNCASGNPARRTSGRSSNRNTAGFG